MSEKPIREAKYNSRYSNKNLYRYSYLLGTPIKGESMAEVDAMRNLEKKYLSEGTFRLYKEICDENWDIIEQLSIPVLVIMHQRKILTSLKLKNYVVEKVGERIFEKFEG
tara:strand:- start:3 stop:332 length:330 start_codon:yes stop_codon:yes gene_type:complete